MAQDQILNWQNLVGVWILGHSPRFEKRYLSRNKVLLETSEERNFRLEEIFNWRLINVVGSKRNL